MTSENKIPHVFLSIPTATEAQFISVDGLTKTKWTRQTVVPVPGGEFTEPFHEWLREEWHGDSYVFETVYVAVAPD